MKPRLQLVIFSIILLSTITQAQTSYIHIVAEPNVSVSIDGELKGMTKINSGGLIIKNLTAKSYLIRLEKEGFIPKEERITLKEGEVLPYYVEPFIPEIEIIQEGNQVNQKFALSTGQLKIQSLPVSIVINIPKLGIESEKIDDVWIAKEVPTGSYAANFKWNEKVYSETIEIRYEKITHVLINVIESTIEDRGFSDISPESQTSDENNPLNYEVLGKVLNKKKKPVDLEYEKIKNEYRIKASESKKKKKERK